MLSVGASVKIHSLKKSIQHNGVRAQITSPYDASTGRWGVKIAGRDLALKSANLTLARDQESTGTVPIVPKEISADQMMVGKIVHELAAAGDWQTLADMEGEALQTALSIKDAWPREAAFIYDKLGISFEKLGQVSKAIELLQNVLAIHDDLGDQVGRANACTNLGLCHSDLGHHLKAIKLFHQAMAIYELMHNRAGQAIVCQGLGNCYTSLGQISKAIEVVEHGLLIDTELGKTANMGKSYTMLGNCHYLVSQYSKAIEQYERVLLIKEAMNDHAGKAKICSNLANCYDALGQPARAIQLYEQALSLFQELADRLGQAGVLTSLGSCHDALGEVKRAMTLYEKALVIYEELGSREGKARCWTNLGICHYTLGLYDTSIQLHEWSIALFKELDDRTSLGASYNNLGTTLIEQGSTTAAVRALTRGLAVLQSVEHDVGSQDDRRVSVFEEQQKTYKHLQGVLLEQLHLPCLALGVSAQAKARALTHRLGADSDRDTAAKERDTAARDHTANRPYEDLCESWWQEVQQMARAEGCATRIIEFSFLFNDKLAVWVLSSNGELLYSTIVPSKVEGLDETNNLTILQILGEVRTSMKVRGRDAMVNHDTMVHSPADSAGKDAVSLSTEHSAAMSSLSRGRNCRVCQYKVCQCAQIEADAEAELAREKVLLQQLYAALIAPIEMFLEDNVELLIVPHRELFEVPWAALIDANGRYLIERHVIRVTPSLRVARQAADSLVKCDEHLGHVVVVGNPLPIRAPFRSLPYAAQEAKTVQELLEIAKIEVLQKHVYLPDSNLKATKACVIESLRGAKWAHLACHADIDSDSLVFAIPSGANGQSTESPDLSMHEVQGNEQGEGVRLCHGATVVLSACNTAKGAIKAEGVVGLSRSFLLANASATVVSLWFVSLFLYFKTYMRTSIFIHSLFQHWHQRSLPLAEYQELTSGVLG